MKLEKRNKIIYWSATTLLGLLMLMGVTMYFLTYDEVTEAFIRLGYPTYLIYPLAIVKVLGMTAIISNKSAILKEWAYAGFFFNLTLALTAHLNVGDGEFPGALLAMTLLSISYIFHRKLLTTSK